MFNTLSQKAYNFFFPIRQHEMKRFLSMSGFMFCILFNQNILRILKDSILVSQVSAEVMSFAKVYCVTPAAALFVVFYAKMVDNLNYRSVYFVLSGVFLSYFAIFGFILYPNTELIHMDPRKVHLLMESYPHFKWFIALVGNWSYVLFYVFAELWPNVFYILMFWQLANETTSTDEAKRFYTLFALIGNSSLIIVGLVIMHLSSESNVFSEGGMLANYFNVDGHVLLIQCGMAMILFFGVGGMLIVQYLYSGVIDISKSEFLKVKDVRTKRKTSLIDSFKYVVRSKYLWLMLICSASFGLSENLVEALWKDRMRELYPTVTSYAGVNGIFVLWSGVTIMLMTIIGNRLMKYHSWFIAAVISPVVIMITGVIFFSCVVFDHEILTFADKATMMSPLALAVTIGAIQNILAKGTKYSIWDTSREMLYIPLDSELRTKGKAAVDVISSKTGKSFSGLIQSVLFMLMPSATYVSIAPFLMVVFVIVCIIWIYAVRQIHDEYMHLVHPLGGS